MVYKSTQWGWFIIIIVLLPLIFLFLFYSFQWGDHPIPLIPTLLISTLLIIIFLLFYKLTIEIKGTTIIIVYGIGLIRIKIEVDKILDVESIKTPWYYGLGVRITPAGMLYNIHGLQAVKINYLSKGENKTVMIGTSEPESFIKALRDTFKNSVD